MHTLPLELEVAITHLQADLTGKVLTPGQTGFKEASTLWNATVTQQPLLVVLPENTQDVVASVQFARAHGLPLSVRGGGHDWAGRSMVTGSVHLNLRRLNGVQVDAAQKTAIVQGGATSMEVIEAAEPYQLVPVTGTVGQVGFAGLTLGGGYGPLSPSFGLATDNVLGAEVVLADGRVCTASAQENTELFWAIRGGGGNFGVVTALHVRLHDAQPLLAGTLVFSAADAAQVLAGYARLMAHAPSQLDSNAGLITTPEGHRVVFLVPFWFGNQAEGEPHIEAFRKLAPLLHDDVQLITYREAVKAQSAVYVEGLYSYAIQTRSLTALDPAAIQTMVEGMQQVTSPMSLVNIHCLHGAATEVAVSATPFLQRQPHYMVELIASWDAKEAPNGQRHAQWASQLSDALQAAALPGGYANLLGPDETKQNEEAYGVNLPRLQQAKRTYDPSTTFKSLSFPLR